MPLTSAGELIKTAWDTFRKTWDTTVRYSVWIVVPGLLQFFEAFIPRNQETLVGVSAFINGLVTILVMLWVTAALYQVALAIEEGVKVTKKTTAAAWSLTPSLLWVGLLEGAATLGALLLLILPGIYVGVRVGLAQVALFQKNMRGRAALAESWAVTKARFWATLWRMLSGTVVFGLLSLAVALMAFTLVGIIAGSAKVDALFAAESTNPLGSGVSAFIQSLVQAAFTPLFIIYQVKLYRALDKTRLA